MKHCLSILLIAGAMAARAGIIHSVGVVADRAGTRVVLQATEEPLSRSINEPDGTLRIEVQGSRTTLGGIHSIPSSAMFGTVQAFNDSRVGDCISVFRFAPRKAGEKIHVKHREWDGRNLVFLFETEISQTPMVDVWNAPEAATTASQQVFASLSVTPILQKANAWGMGEFETLEFEFATPTIKAELVGSGKKLVIRLGKARLAGKLAPPASSTKLVQSVTASKEDGSDVLIVTLKQDPRSALLSRSGSNLVLRLVSQTPTQVAWNWDSKGGKVESFNAAQLPSDETADLSSIRKSLSTVSGEGFSMEGSRSPMESKGALGGSTAPSADVGALTEAQKMEAERRKSREFVDRKVAEDVAQQEAADKKNRVVYNTFGIRDPFIPLEADDAEGGLNIDQMKVAGIIASPTRPMAVLEHATQPGLSVALKEGDLIQNGRVLRIERDRVVFLLEEFGVSRQFVLKLQAPKGDKS